MPRNPNRMQEATDRLMRNFQSKASILVSYSRGATTITGIAATKGRTPFEVVDGPVMTAFESTHYIINASDLATFDDPASGDIITDPDGSKHVASVPSPFHLFERMGPLGSVLKIHTAGIS